MDMSSAPSIEPIRKVVLAVDLSDASWRDFLMGFFDYAKRNTHWFMRVVQSNEELEKSVAESHGVVIGIKNPGRVISACARHKVPFAVVASESLPPPGTGVPSACVRNDNEGIGRFCAECFMSLGRFAAAAFVSSRAGDDWSAARETFSTSPGTRSARKRNLDPTMTSRRSANGLPPFQSPSP